MWFKTIALITVALVACFVLTAIYGSFRWRSGTEKLRARLNAGRQPITPTAYDARVIEGLPAPVQRYFRAVLKDGQPMIAAIKLTHAGQFSLGEAEPKWPGNARKARCHTGAGASRGLPTSLRVERTYSCRSSLRSLCACTVMA